jgi:hypothetical protein
MAIAKIEAAAVATTSLVDKSPCARLSARATWVLCFLIIMIINSSITPILEMRKLMFTGIKLIYDRFET